MNMCRVRLTCLLVLVAAVMVTRSSFALVMTFEDAQNGARFPRLEVYRESGLAVRSYCDNGWFGDLYHLNPTGIGVWFSAPDDYIRLFRDGGGRFDLNSFDFMTHGPTNPRWLRTSAGAFQYLPLVPWQHLTFLGPEFSNLSFVDIGTAFGYTAVDNITCTPNPIIPVPEPGSLALVAVGVGLLALLRGWAGRSR
jgi:hypothetical protein